VARQFKETGILMWSPEELEKMYATMILKQPRAARITAFIVFAANELSKR
jgi:hypothetical protein